MRNTLGGAGGLWALPTLPLPQLGWGWGSGPISRRSQLHSSTWVWKGQHEATCIHQHPRQAGGPWGFSGHLGRQSWRKDQLAGFHCPIFEYHWPPAGGAHRYHLLSGRGIPETERKRDGLQIWGGPLRQRKGMQ